MEDNIIKNLPSLDELYPLLDKEAKSKGLQIFIFDKEDLKEFFIPRFNNIAVVTIAKNQDNAKWNIKNYKHSYLIQVPDEESSNKV